MNVKISGTGSYKPDFVLTNEKLAKIVETNDEWIVKRTGISERRINLDKTNWEMAAEASMRAIENAGINPDDITMIIAGTATNDYYTPSLACCVQKAISAPNAFAFDVAAACSGFVYAISVAESMMKTGAAGTGHTLVICSENLSRITDYTDRSTCILFGDGAGAVILSRTEDDCGILSTSLYSDGSKLDSLYAKSLNPVLSDEEGRLRNNDVKPNGTLSMLGAEVLKFAVRIIPEMLTNALNKINMKTDDITHYLFHQANIRIISGAAERIGNIQDKIRLNIDKLGNTSSASIPILLDEINHSGILKKGDVIAAVGFGAGLTAGAAIIRW